MQHLTEAQLLELIGGHLGPGDSAAAEDHLDACDACRLKHQQLFKTWQVLGQWEAARPDRDLREPIVAAADRRQGTWRRSALVAMKAAAAIVLAWAVGYEAGRSYRPEAPMGPEELKQRAAASIYLDAFESGTPAGLSEYVLADSRESGEKEQ